MMRLVTRTLTALGLMLGLGLLAACGGGDDVKSSASPGASSTATQGGGGPTSNGDQQLPEAGPELSAYHLLDAAGYAAALGEQVTAVEDDGVVPDRYGCEIGQARALTAAGVLITTDLRTAASTDDAKQDYTSLTNGGSIASPLSGAGDQSAYADSIALVQKGAQVLRVVSEIAPGVDPKAGGADPTAALAAAAAAAGKAAPALAAKMGGAACSGPALGLPAGALPPCTTTASDLQSALGMDVVTVTPAISDEPPFLQCDYGLGEEGTVSVYIATTEQMRHAAPALVAADYFAQKETAAQNPRRSGTYETFSSGPFHAFGATSGNIGMDEEAYFEGIGLSTLNIDDADVHQAMYRVTGPGDTPVPLDGEVIHILQSGSGGQIAKNDCKPFLHSLILGKSFEDRIALEVQAPVEGVGEALQDYSRFQDAITRFCEALADKGTFVPAGQ